MQLIGFNFKKISAERKEIGKGKIEVKANVNIKDVNQEKTDLFKDQSAIKFDFEFSVVYSPNLASLSFEGSTVLLLSKDESKEVLKKWKDKKVTEDVRVFLFNNILTRCNLRALQLEEELGLPTHIPMPVIRPEQIAESKDKKNSYTG